MSTLRAWRGEDGVTVVEWAGCGDGEHEGDIQWLGRRRSQVLASEHVVWEGDTGSTWEPIDAHRVRVRLSLASGQYVVGEVKVARES